MGVLKHVCLFRLKAPPTDELLDRLGEYERRCRATFPEITVYRFGRNASRKGAAFPLVLYSEFPDEVTLRRYVASSFHDNIAAFLEPLVEDTLVADIFI